MKKLFIDIETYSSVDLKKSNVYRYAEAPDFDIMMAAWAIDDGPVNLALGMEEIDRIPGLWDPAVLKVAHNAAFERICFSSFQRYTAEAYGHDVDIEGYLPPEHWEDSMVLASEHGYPKGLDALAKALGAEEKDSAGTRLISLFCKPNRKGGRNTPEAYPEQWEEFKAYAIQDVVTLRDVYRRLPGWPPREREAWLVDQRINDTGIPVDVVMAKAAVDAGERNGAAALTEIKDLTGLANPNSPVQMQTWLREQGVILDNLQAATVTDLLDGQLAPNVRRVLELRQETALIAAKKYQAALDRVSADNRLRGSFQFFGAHTGRFAGRGVQLQNLPSASLGEKTDSFDEVERKILAGVLDLKLGLGATAHELKALVRPMFVGPFTVVDYSAIEARVLAWLAGEQWALDAFAAGRDIYLQTAERLGPGFTRKEGKVAALALGYGSGVNGLAAFGAEGGEDHLLMIRDKWREANPNIVQFWRDLEDAFQYGDRLAGKHIYVTKDGSDRHVQLPSGRAMVYHDMRGRIENDPWGRPRMKMSFASPKGMRTTIYGGLASENLTQAVARDVLTEALVRLVKAGHEVVGSVHDEVIVLGSSVDEIKPLMVQMPDWAEGLPLDAAGYECSRYRKD